MRIAAETLTLHSAGHYHQAHGIHPVPICIPPFFERVELVTSGRGAIRHEGEWRVVTTGDLIWNRPGDETIGQSDFSDPYRCLAVTFVGPHREGHAKVPRFSRWEEREEVLRFTHEAVRLHGEPGFEAALLRDYVLSRLLFQIHRWHTARQPELPAPLRVALRWVAAYYAGPCPAEAIARACGWSAPHLRHAFRRHLGLTPHQAVVRERVRAARERLISTTLPMKQIAHECGFGDAPAFNRTFRAAEGMTPGAYRKRYLALSGLPRRPR